MKATFKNISRKIKKSNFAIFIVIISILLALLVFYFLNILNSVYDKSNSIYNISNLKEMDKTTLDILNAYQKSNANSNIDNLSTGRANPFSG